MSYSYKLIMISKEQSSKNILLPDDNPLFSKENRLLELGDLDKDIIDSFKNNLLLNEDLKNMYGFSNYDYYIVLKENIIIIINFFQKQIKEINDKIKGLNLFQMLLLQRLNNITSFEQYTNDIEFINNVNKLKYYDSLTQMNLDEWNYFFFQKYNDEVIKKITLDKLIKVQKDLNFNISCNSKDILISEKSLIGEGLGKNIYLGSNDTFEEAKFTLINIYKNFDFNKYYLVILGN